jgi:hypothetical protein
MTTGPLDILTMLGLPEALVNSCRDILEDHAGEIHNAGPTGVNGVFGGSEAGADLDHQVSIAHQHVKDALEEMVQGLRAYATNLNEFARHLNDTDLQAAADLTPSRKNQLADAASHLNAHDFHGDRSGGGQ